MFCSLWLCSCCCVLSPAPPLGLLLLLLSGALLITSLGRAVPTSPALHAYLSLVIVTPAHACPRLLAGMGRG